MASQLWLVVGAVIAAALMPLAFCRVCLTRKLEGIRGLWDDIYFRLRERCELIGRLSEQLRARLKTNPKLADDIEYLLTRMEETNDPHTHAAVQNGLVLTVQTAVEQFHRDRELQEDAELFKTIQAISAVDSRLIPYRDRFNDSVRGYNKLLNLPPFSLLARLTREGERPLFPMLIPWWSWDPVAYGAITADEIRQTLQAWRAPLILAPSQRMEWSGGARVIRVADKLLQRESAEGGEKADEGV